MGESQEPADSPASPESEAPPEDSAAKRKLDHGLILMTGLVLFVITPGFMIDVSPGDYEFLDPAALIGTCLALLLLFVALFEGAYWVAARFGRRVAARNVLIFLLCWACSAGLLFPVSASVGLVDPIAVPVNPYNLLATTGLSVAVTLGTHTKYVRQIGICAVVFFVVTVLPLVPTLWSFVFVTSASEEMSNLAVEENILVVSLDGLPGGITTELIRESPERRRAFKDFLVFEQAVSTSPATLYSLATELHGNHDVTTTKPDPKRLLMNGSDYDTYTYGTYNWFNLDHDRRVLKGHPWSDQDTFARRLNDVSLFLRYVTARIGTCYLVQGTDLVSEPLLSATVGILDSRQQDSDDLSSRLLAHSGPEWDRKFVRTIRDFRGFSRSLTRGTEKKGLRYLHFDFTHYPVDFDEHGKYRGDDPEWHAANQNEVGVANETAGALDELAQLVARLRELGLYERSLIVFKSDHGKPVMYYSKPPGNYRINGNRRWGYDRYRPFLAIKPPSRQRDEPAFVSTMVLLDDLAVTLNRVAKRDTGGDTFSGVDLLGDDLASTAPFVIHVPKDESSTFLPDTHLAVKLLRAADLVESIRASSEIELTEHEP